MLADHRRSYRHQYFMDNYYTKATDFNIGGEAPVVGVWGPLLLVAHQGWRNVGWINNYRRIWTFKTHLLSWLTPRYKCKVATHRYTHSWGNWFMTCFTSIILALRLRPELDRQKNTRIFFKKKENNFHKNRNLSSVYFSAVHFNTVLFGVLYGALILTWVALSQIASFCT